MGNTETFQLVLEKLQGWHMTRRLLRQYKRTEYLSSSQVSQEQLTRILMGAMLEFGVVVKKQCGVPVNVHELLNEFLAKQRIDTGLQPDYQWERVCKHKISKEELLYEGEGFRSVDGAPV